MKLKLSLVLIVACAAASPAQKAVDKPAVTDDKAKIAAQKIILRKQIVVDELDNQAKDVPLAAVRIYARAKIAEWLWKNGKDETGRAESLAVRAVEELYEKKDEIPNYVFLSTELFGLLELNAKDAAKKLRAKYKIEEAEDLQNAISLLFKPGGDKILAEKIKKSLANNKDLTEISYLLYELRARKSNEFIPILIEIVALEETGRNSFTPNSFFALIDGFREAAVSNDMKIRFYRLVINKAKSELQNINADGALETTTTADILLNAVLPDIGANAPELFGEANAVKSALAAKTSPQLNLVQERDRRISESTDKVAAIIEEAEKADSKGEKHELYNYAAETATAEGKFQLAVDLYDKAFENLTLGRDPKPEFFHDQQLNEIVGEALGKRDAESAEYATKRIISGLFRSDALRQTALYQFQNKDSASALNNFDEALRLVAKEPDDRMKFYTLFKMIPAAQTIDADRVSETTTLAARTIDRLPTLNPDDKPGTENFKQYVSTIMAINVNVSKIMSDLVKTNKPEARDFAVRINRKEVKLIADLVLALNAIETEKKTSNAK